MTDDSERAFEEKLARDKARRDHVGDRGSLTWAQLCQRYFKIKSVAAAGDIGETDIEIADFMTRFATAQIELLLFPAPNAEALYEKFSVLRDALLHDLNVFTDRRERLFLTALEADSLRLIKQAQADAAHFVANHA